MERGLLSDSEKERGRLNAHQAYRYMLCQALELSRPSGCSLNENKNWQGKGRWNVSGAQDRHLCSSRIAKSQELRIH